MNAERLSRAARWMLAFWWYRLCPLWFASWWHRRCVGCHGTSWDVICHEFEKSVIRCKRCNAYKYDMRYFDKDERKLAKRYRNY